MNLSQAYQGWQQMQENRELYKKTREAFRKAWFTLPTNKPCSYYTKEVLGTALAETRVIESDKAKAASVMVHVLTFAHWAEPKFNPEPDFEYSDLMEYTKGPLADPSRIAPKPEGTTTEPPQESSDTLKVREFMSVPELDIKRIETNTVPEPCDEHGKALTDDIEPTVKCAKIDRVPIYTMAQELGNAKTMNMVGPALQMPEVLGLNPPVSNNCDLQTDGWELNFSWRDRTRFGLGYSIAANVSDAMGTILSYPGNTTHSINTYMEGKRVGEIWGFTTVGIAKSNEEMQAHLAKNDQSSIGSQWGEGDIMYKDINGDGVVNRGESTWESHGDLSIIGNSTPRYHFGINMSADFKGFDVRIFLQGVGKHDLWTDSAQYWGCPGYVWNVCGYGEHNDYYRAKPAGIAGHEIIISADFVYSTVAV